MGGVDNKIEIIDRDGQRCLSTDSLKSTFCVRLVKGLLTLGE